MHCWGTFTSLWSLLKNVSVCTFLFLTTEEDFAACTCLLTPTVEQLTRQELRGRKYVAAWQRAGVWFPQGRVFTCGEHGCAHVQGCVNTMCWYSGGSQVLAISLEKCLDHHHGTKKGNCVAKVSSAQPQKGEAIIRQCSLGLRLNF